MNDVTAREQNSRRRNSPAWLAEVIVMPKPGVNDPEGEAILGGLHSLGHDAVTGVRAGRVLRLTVEATNTASAQVAVERMCEQLLANPVIETYQIAIAPLESDAEVGI